MEDGRGLMEDVAVKIFERLNIKNYTIQWLDDVKTILNADGDVGTDICDYLGIPRRYNRYVIREVLENATKGVRSNEILLFFLQLS